MFWFITLIQHNILILPPALLPVLPCDIVLAMACRIYYTYLQTIPVKVRPITQETEQSLSKHCLKLASLTRPNV